MHTHDTSIPRATRRYISIDTDTRYALPTCEASENGVECWRHAEVEYVTRHLCKQCYSRLWSIILAWHKERVATCEAEEYEPPYTRADEMADLANADYWDEVARGGYVA